MNIKSSDNQIDNILDKNIMYKIETEFNAIIVKGAGSPGVDGIYILNGEQNGKNIYYFGQNYIGYEGSPLTWNINEFDNIGGTAYLSYDNTEYPWQSRFQVFDGEGPIPKLTPTVVII
jgi:hypothetical protein